jgi:glycosyltransferase involved in cell wall biosynthesis
LDRNGMRIVQALGSSGRGGAERFFIRLAKALHAREIPQAVLTRRKAWAAEQLSQAGIAAQTAWFGGKFDIITRAKYRRALHALHAGIAINWMPNAAAACPEGPWVRVARLGKCYPLEAFQACDHLIANSPRIAAHIKAQGWPASRVSYIPNFVAENKTAPARRSAFNTPEDAPLVVWLGRMAHDKGPDLIVRALAETPKAYLWMAGAGAYEEDVKTLAAQLGLLPRIRFLGWRDDINALLGAADIFVRTGRGEGIGNILEAWANWLPPISARSEDTDHLIVEGETGLLVPKDDPAALAVALKSLISNRDLARRIGIAGRAKFKESFSEEPVTGAYLDLCRRLKEEYAWRARTHLFPGAGVSPEFAR